MTSNYQILKKLYHKIFIILIINLSLVTQTVFSQEIFNYLFSAGDEIIAERKKEIIYKDKTLYFHPLRLLEIKKAALSYGFYLEDIYREKKQNNLNSLLSNFTNNVFGIFPLKIKTFRNVFAFSVHYLDFKAIENSSKQRKLNFSNNNFSYLFSYAIDFNSKIKLGISLQNKRLKRRSFFEYCLETIVQPVSWANIGYSKKSSSMNYRTELTYEDIFIDLPLNFVQCFDNYFLNISSFKFLKMNLEYQKNYLKQHKNLFSQSDYVLNPGGEGDKWRISAIVNLQKRLKFILSSEQETFDSYGRFYYNDLQFGKITRFKFDKIDYFFRLYYQLSNFHTINGGYGWIDFDGTTKGHIESWPFTSTLIDLLGSRAYFRTSGDLLLTNVIFGYQYSQMDLFKFGINLKYINIKPDGNLFTWKPAFLVFGVEDLNSYFVKYKTIDGLILKLGSTYRFKKINVYFSFGQFIPVFLKKREEVTEKPKLPSEESIGRKKADGGRFLSATLSYEF